MCLWLLWYLLPPVARERSCEELLGERTTEKSGEVCKGWLYLVWRGNLKILRSFLGLCCGNSRTRDGKTTKQATIKTRFQAEQTVNIQLVTKENATLSQVAHKWHYLYPLSDPIVNPCPSTIRVFAMGKIAFLTEVWGNVFKAKIGDNLVCVKAAPVDDLRSEVEALIRAPHHPKCDTQSRWCGGWTCRQVCDSFHTTQAACICEEDHCWSEECVERATIWCSNFPS